MEEEKSLQHESGEPADIICKDCIGNIVQAELQKNAARLFSPQYYVKWVYFCQKCNHQSKVFYSKLAKPPTQQQ